MPASTSLSTSAELPAGEVVCCKPWRHPDGSLANCWCFGCQLHGHSERNRRFLNYQSRLPQSKFFFTAVVHLNAYPQAKVVGAIATAIVKGMESLRGVVKCVVVPHYEAGDWHLHLGAWANEVVSEESVREVVGRSDQIVCKTSIPPRPGLLLPEPNPEGWLSYVLRTDPEGKPYTPPPQGWRYRLIYGWPVPKRVARGKVVQRPAEAMPIEVAEQSLPACDTVATGTDTAPVVEASWAGIGRGNHPPSNLPGDSHFADISSLDYGWSSPMPRNRAPPTSIVAARGSAAEKSPLLACFLLQAGATI